MEAFGIGPFELALVVLIAFIVLGPDRIPGVMRQLGIWVRQLRELTNNITRDYGTDIQQLTGEITALQEELRSIQREIGQVATGFMTTTLPSDPDHSIAPKGTAAAGSMPEPSPAPTDSSGEPSPAPADNSSVPPSDPAPAETNDSYTI